MNSLETIHARAVKVNMRGRHYYLLHKFCELYRLDPAEYLMEVIGTSIEAIAKEKLGIDSDSPEGRYYELYGNWVLRHQLVQNTPKQKLDTELTETAVRLYGMEEVLNAVKKYSMIFFCTRHYVFVPEYTFEEFIKKGLKDFVSTARITPEKRYGKPRMTIKPEIIKSIKRKKRKKKKKRYPKKQSERAVAKREKVNEARLKVGLPPLTKRGLSIRIYGDRKQSYIRSKQDTN